MEKSDILKYLIENNEIFDDIYLGREEKLIQIRAEVKEKILKEKVDLNKKYDNFITSLKKLRLGEDDVETLLSKFNEYFEEKNYKDGIINEEYYKEGLKDGIKIVTLSLFKWNY